MHSLPPAALLPLLNRFADERLVGHALTAGVHRFEPPTLRDPQPNAAIWVACTDKRFWLVAHEPDLEQTWAVAVGEPSQLHLESGWQRDTLHVGPWSVPLRRGGRREIEQLIERFGKQDPRGDPWPLDLAWPGPPALSAPGVEQAESAPPVPQHSAQERLLVALELDHKRTISGFDGPEDHPIWLWISTHRALLAAGSPGGAPPWTLALPAGPLPIEGRKLVVQGCALQPRGSKARVALAETLAASPTPAARWALAVRHRVICGEPTTALAVLGAAHAQGAHEQCWPHLAQVCLAMDQGVLAGSASWRALQEQPDLDPAAVANLWRRESSALARSLRGVSWREVRELTGEVLDSLAGAPPPPEALPRPPRSPAEVWSSALAAAGQFRKAHALWPAPGSPRGHLAHAVLATLAEQPDSDRAWWAAAEAAHAAGSPPWFALANAADQRETAALRWRWGHWAWIEGHLHEARASWRRAIALDGGAGALSEPLPAEALRALAEVCVQIDRPIPAARVLEAAANLDPACEPTRLRYASLLAELLGRPLAAADLRAGLARDLAAGILRDPQVPLWAHLRDAALLRARGGQPDGALATLHQLVESCFLEPQALRAAIDCDEVYVPGVTREWWRHLHGVLTTGQGGQPLSPVSHPTDAFLAGLHPEPAGWRASPAPRIGAARGPDYITLSRGLDRLERAGFDRVASLLDHLSADLDLEERPVGFVFRGQGAWGISSWPCSPPVVLVGAEHLLPGTGRTLDEAELAFAIAAELLHLRCQHPVLAFEATLLGSSRNLFDQLGGWAGAAGVIVELLSLLPGLDQASKVGTLWRLTRAALKAQGEVGRALQLADPVVSWLSQDSTPEPHGLSREKLTRAALGMRVQAERGALILTGDLQAAVRAVLKLSTQAVTLAPQVARRGLLDCLSDPESTLSPAEAYRLTALLGYAASLRPAGAVASPQSRTRLRE